MSADTSAELGNRVYSAAISDRNLALTLAILGSYIAVCAMLYHTGTYEVRLGVAIGGLIGGIAGGVGGLFGIKTTRISVHGRAICMDNVLVQRTYPLEQIGKITVGRPVHRAVVREGYRFRRLPAKESNIAIRVGRIKRISAVVIGSGDLLSEITEAVPDVEIIRRRYGKD